MAFSFKVDKPKDLQSTLSKLKSEAAKHHVHIEGDDRGGRGSGYSFSGSYAVHADCIIVNVNKKPFLVPNSLIEKKVRAYLSQDGFRL